MTAILSADQMRAAEQALFGKGVDPYALMEKAAAAAAETIWRVGGHRDLLVLCGPGNNGGDGYVVARLLRERGVPVRVAASGEPAAASAKRARAAWNGPVEAIAEAAPATQAVDALFGIGLTRALELELAGHLNRLTGAASRSYAIDLPSGVDTDSGALLSPAPSVDLCITFGAWKPAHWLQPSAGLMSQRLLCDIGIDCADATMQLLERPHFPAPPTNAHKYMRGLVAVVAGEMPGAAALSAEAAARSGAGYVRLLYKRRISHVSQAIVQLTDLEYDRARSLLIGPGLGRTKESRALLHDALKSGVPVVADADALALLSERLFANLVHPSIVTPHEGEFVRLFGDRKGSKIDRTRAAAQGSGAVVVHKGPDTVIAAPDGRVVVAPPASSWLSTAGTGDVLAGMIAARLAATGDPFRSACEGVWLQGAAARLAGPAFIADDLLDYLGAAMTS